MCLVQLDQVGEMKGLLNNCQPHSLERSFLFGLQNLR